jgi:hypothetical protein
VLVSVKVACVVDVSGVSNMKIVPFGVADVSGIVNIEVVTFDVIDEYTISVETYSGPATAVILSVGPRRSTAG